MNFTSPVTVDEYLHRLACAVDLIHSAQCATDKHAQTRLTLHMETATRLDDAGVRLGCPAGGAQVMTADFEVMASGRDFAPPVAWASRWPAVLNAARDLLETHARCKVPHSWSAGEAS